MESQFLLINKPKEWTSHDVVGYLRKQYPRKTKVGHAGTLDPFATGLLIVGVGRESTKRLDEFKNMPKVYIATLKLGATSTTFDPEGEITLTPNSNNQTQTITNIEETLQSFVGKQLQIPPMFSAKKVGGQKLYDLARKGIEIERQPNEIEIYNIELLEYNNKLSPYKGEQTRSDRGGQTEDELPTLKIKVGCSTGTYIRTLAHDIGQKLGCGAYCEELERTSIGEYKLEDAQSISNPRNEGEKSLSFVKL